MFVTSPLPAPAPAPHLPPMPAQACCTANQMGEHMQIKINPSKQGISTESVPTFNLSQSNMNTHAGMKEE